MEKTENALYRVGIQATGAEAEGGRGVTTGATQLVSALPWLIGYKADGDLGYVSMNSTRMLDVIAVDPSLKRIAVPDLQETLLELKWVSVLMKQPNGTYKYESVHKELEKSTKAFAMGDKGARVSLSTRDPGDFAWVLRSKDGTEYMRVDYSVAGKANVSR